MTEVKDVTGTAFVVAEFRARENAEPHPLYLDLIVPIFLDDRTKRAADRIAAGFAAAEKNVRLRTRYLDDRLDEQLANGCRQVVILGLGSTRGPCANGRRASLFRDRRSEHRELQAGAACGTRNRCSNKFHCRQLCRSGRPPAT